MKSLSNLDMACLYHLTIHGPSSIDDIAASLKAYGYTFDQVNKGLASLIVHGLARHVGYRMYGRCD